MNVEDFVFSALPFLNSGMILLILDIAFRRIHLEITLKNYREKPFQSLCTGLFLVALSSVLYNIARAWLSGVTMVAALLILLFIYFLAVFGKRGRTR
jgi:hypothetical protein